MFARNLVFRQAVRFCTKGSSSGAVTSTTSDDLIEAQKMQDAKVPLHMRPYNAAKYEVPMKKIKKNSGYALVQIEPFPRARIMKICYHILAEVRKQIPEDFFFRVFIEERTKYIMQVVDNQQDVETIERVLTRGLPIQIYTRNLADQLTLINFMKSAKLWEKSAQVQEQAERAFVEQHEDLQHHRNPQYKKGERPKAAFV